jgi:voltage-gated potassium channel
MTEHSDELKNTSYELFIAALSVLSIANLFIIVVASDPVMQEIAVIMDIPLTIIFLGDFVYRFITAKSRTTYFVRQFGWADLLASIPAPQLKLLRLFRIWRAARLMSHYGVRRLLDSFLHDRASSALLTVLLLLMLVVEFGAMLVYFADRSSPDANIKTAADAIWWAYITVTTIGYGDRFPVTAAGRWWATLVAAAGVGLFGVLTGFLANAFLSPKAAEDTATPEQSEPAGMTERLDTIADLLAEQRQAQATLLERLAALEQVLGATSRPNTLESQRAGPEDGSRTT